MALALEISITRRLENLLTLRIARVRKIIYGVAPNGGARHRGGMF